MLLPLSVRPLALFVKPIAGESFASYMDRLSSVHEVPLLTMLARTGIIDAEDVRMLNPGYGIALPEARLESFAYATRLKPSQVQSMLLTTYDGIAINLSGVNLANPDSLRIHSLSEWAYLAGSHVCAHCIEEDEGAWQIAWKLPWLFACPRHGIMLIDTCPRCNRRIGQGRSEHGTIPTFTSMVAQPGTCANPRPDGTAGLGRSARPCGQPLASIPVVNLARWPQILEAQKAVIDALQGNAVMVAGEPVAPKTYFDSLRSLSAMLLYAAQPEDFPFLPQIVAEAFRTYAEDRDGRIEARLDLRNRRNGSHTRVYLTPPRSAALMAAIVPIAHRLLTSASLNELSGQLNGLVESIKARSPSYAWQIPDYFKLTGALRTAYSRCMETRAHFDRHVGSRSVVATSKGFSVAFSPAHVPQLLWKDQFDCHFARLITDVRENNARRFCSMALVKLCGNYTWLEAAALLDLPASAADGMANRIVGILNVSGNMKNFGQRLNQLATEFSSSPPWIDYAARRQRLAEFREIPDNDWMGICHQAGISFGNPHSRQRYAAAWVWAEVTGGDWTLAPALQGGNTQNLREVFSRQFMKNIFPKVKDELWKYTQSLTKIV